MILRTWLEIRCPDCGAVQFFAENEGKNYRCSECTATFNEEGLAEFDDLDVVNEGETVEFVGRNRKEYEVLRTQQLNELIHHYGSLDKIVRNFGKVTIGNHEALDRTSLAIDFFSDHIGEHPTVVMTPKYFYLASDIVNKMADLYEALGRDELPE